MNKTITPYGKYITVDGKKMYTSVSGSGNKVILLLPCLGSTSPIIEMKPLTSFLTNKYTVVTIEYFGYGISDDTNIERTVENIVDETHCAMQALGFNRYSIAAHSISGLYCLEYVNKYHDEVEAFIGIDATVPQYEDTDETDKIASSRLKRKFNDNALCRWKTRYYAKLMLKMCRDYKYSKTEIKTYEEIAVRGIHSNAIINEASRAKQNMRQLRSTRFPDDIKILYILASYTERIIPLWHKWHEEMLNSDGMIEIMKGTHYLHMQYPQTVAEKIDAFLSGIR